MYLLQTFGGLTLTHATTHQLIGTPRRKPLALLAIVAASGDRGVERDGIATMLWPELDEMHARRALSQTLYALRRELGDDVLRDSPRLTIDPTKLTSDAGEFQELARPGGTRRDLERAAALYGGPYLDGVYFPGCAEFEHWAEMARAVHAAAYLGVLREIARLADAPRAIEWLERAAREFPLDSDTAAALARAYADSGRHAQAYAFLNAHFAALQAELGTSPPDHLVSLGRELQTAPTGPRITKRATTPARREAGNITRTPAASPRTRTSDDKRQGSRHETGIGVLTRSSSRLQRVGGIAATFLGVVAAAWAFRWKPTEHVAESLSTAFAREIAWPGGAGASGRVLVRVNTVSGPVPLPMSTTGLATYTNDVLTPALAKVATLMPREQIEALNERVRAHRPGALVSLDLTRHLLEMSDAQLALEGEVVDFDGRSDSIGLGITLYRRTIVPPCPEGWTFGPRDVADTGSYEGVESWSSFRLRTPRARPTKYVDSLVHSARRMLESMNSCDLDAHRGLTTAPWCWTGANGVRVVPGVLRARLSAGENVSMTMVTNRLPGGRSRYCMYSPAMRMSFE
jgi:DNA-binding SARP family transcriptional activator